MGQAEMPYGCVLVSLTKKKEEVAGQKDARPGVKKKRREREGENNRGQ